MPKSLIERCKKGISSYLKKKKEYNVQQSPFARAVHEYFEDGKNSPMYETYINYALRTNDRGVLLARTLSQYLELKNKSYLDIGTAYGGYIVAFARKGCSPYLGLEIDEKFVNLCKLNLMEQGLSPNCILQFNICNPLPGTLEDNKYDIITCTDVLEHVLNVPRALENMKRLMGDGGHLYLETPNRYYINNVLSDPHFGLFGITLLDRQDAIEYFKYLRAGDYLVADYHEFDYYLSFFPEAYFGIKTLSTENIDFTEIDTLFKEEIENKFESKMENLPIPMEMKEKLKVKFKHYIAQYIKQMQKRNIEYFYFQNWKILIQKK
jgi:2-polyprenyl-3-methyl-5-hydroxy-6-metoxy-1,4-benzoquinol methylase